MVSPIIPGEKQALARFAAASKCTSGWYPHLGIIGMFAWLPTIVLHPVMLTKVAWFIEDLAAVLVRTLPCLFARLMKAVHMFLPIRRFAKRLAYVLIKYAEPPVLLLFGGFPFKGL